MKEVLSSPNQKRSAKHWFIAVGVCLLLGVVTVAANSYLKHRPQVFIEHWSQLFANINNLAEAKRLAAAQPVVITRVFPSGEWLVATCEHDCCSGAGYNATVIRDSTGSIYTDTTHTFCGIEGLGEELGARLNPATSLQEFYLGLSQIRFQKR